MANLNIQRSDFIGVLTDPDWLAYSREAGLPRVENGALVLHDTNGLATARASYVADSMTLNSTSNQFKSKLKVLLDGTSTQPYYTDGFSLILHNATVPNDDTAGGGVGGYQNFPTPSIAIHIAPDTFKIHTRINGRNWGPTSTSTPVNVTDLIGQLYVWYELEPTTHQIKVWVSKSETKPVTPDHVVGFYTALENQNPLTYFNGQVNVIFGCSGRFNPEDNLGGNATKNYKLQEFYFQSSETTDPITLPEWGGAAPVDLIGTDAGLDDITGARIPYPQGAQKRLYFIGNSVTDTVNYSDLETIAEDPTLSEYTHIWGRKMIPGAPLDYHYEYLEEGLSESPFGLPSNAFPNYVWDDISFQPFSRHLTPDREAITDFLALAKQNPENIGNTRPWIYGWWCSLNLVKSATGLTGSGADGALVIPDDLAILTPQHWRDTWLNQVYDTSTENGPFECQDYYEKLTLAVRADHPDLPPALMIPIGRVMNTLNEKMAAGEIPGYTSIFQLYADGVHLNSNGRFLACMTAYAALYWQDPRGIQPTDELAAEVDPDLIAPITDSVYETVFSYNLAGSTLGSANQPPTAVLNTDVTTGKAPLTVSFNASGSSDPDEDDSVFGYEWNFGDGSGIAFSNAVTHTYTTPGTYTVTLRVQDEALTYSDPVTQTITVEAANVAPTADFTFSPSTGEAPLTVSFDASGSSDSDGTITAYEWDFGDSLTNNRPNPTVDHTFQNPGAYAITLRVQDSDGAYSTNVVKAIAVSEPANQPPVASFTSSVTSGIAPLTVSFDASGSTDPDGTIAAYAWDFGDGTTGTGVTASHTYSDPGAYVVRLRVQDTLGAYSETQSIAIDVNAESTGGGGTTNNKPTVSFTADPVTGNAPMTVAFTSIAADSDGTIEAYEWTFGDGTGSIEANPSHQYTEPGAYLVKLRVQDNSGVYSDYATIAIDVNAVSTPTDPSTPQTNLTVTQVAKLMTFLGVSARWVMDAYLNAAFQQWGKGEVISKVVVDLQRLAELETTLHMLATNVEYAVKKTKNVELDVQGLVAQTSLAKKLLKEELAAFLGVPLNTQGYPGYTKLRKK